MENPQGRRVLITGGSRDWCLAILEALLARGAKVTVLARTRARLRDAEQLGADAIEGDATDAPLMDGLVADISPDVARQRRTIEDTVTVLVELLAAVPAPESRIAPYCQVWLLG